MYSIEFTKKAFKQLNKLTPPIRVRIISNLKRIRIRPHSFLKKIIGEPYFGLRVGDYRLIIKVMDEKLIIYVVEIGHRKQIYKKLRGFT